MNAFCNKFSTQRLLDITSQTYRCSLFSETMNRLTYTIKV